MEIIFCEFETEEQLLSLDLFQQDEDGTQLYDWPHLPRIGESINLMYEKGKEIVGIVKGIHWSSIGGYLNAVAIYIDRIKE